MAPFRLTTGRSQRRTVFFEKARSSGRGPVAARSAAPSISVVRREASATQSALRIRIAMIVSFLTFRHEAGQLDPQARCPPSLHELKSHDDWPGLSARLERLEVSEHVAEFDDRSFQLFLIRRVEDRRRVLCVLLLLLLALILLESETGDLETDRRIDRFLRGIFQPDRIFDLARQGVIAGGIEDELDPIEQAHLDPLPFRLRRFGRRSRARLPALLLRRRLDLYSGGIDLERAAARVRPERVKH